MTNRCSAILKLLVALLTSAGNAAIVRGDDASPKFWAWATTPPMGWNSYDAFGDSVTEPEILANVKYMKAHLLSHGWRYVVVDYRWYDPGAHDNDANKRAGAPLTVDGNGRLLPSPNRFPSAADGKGFKPLADELHAMGFRFGIHVMRGIPRLGVNANAPIEGTVLRASDAADVNNICKWCPDMYGVNATTAAGQAYYDSIFRLYAGWGVDYVKVDDLSRPYSTNEIEAIRIAIDRCGRPIVFSTSPGETSIEHADHIAMHANSWRVSDDLWDDWNPLNHAFDLAARWQGHGGTGHWPDLDMLPLGHIGIRSVGKPRTSRFTAAEKITLMSLWAIAPSPLMLGGNLPDNSPADLALITNDAMIAINQDRSGHQAIRIVKNGDLEVWMKQLSGGDKAVGFFNRGKTDGQITVTWHDLGITGKYRVRDVWSEADLGVMEGSISQAIPAHGAGLVRLNIPR